MEIIFKHLERISPQAKEFFSNCLINNSYEVFICNDNGVYLVAYEEKTCIFFASFIDEKKVDLNFIGSKTREIIDKNTDSEICFNVFLDNTSIIEQIRSMGFVIDMEGFHMEYKGNTPFVSDSLLTVKGYSAEMIDHFVELLTEGYYNLNRDNGWDVDGYKNHKEQYNKALINHYERNGLVKTFWKNDELIGTFLLSDNYIEDLVVHPKYQNQGFGTLILNTCISYMTQKELSPIRLRVAKSNISAKRFYEKNGFKVISAFAEHTLNK